MSIFQKSNDKKEILPKNVLISLSAEIDESAYVYFSIITFEIAIIIKS